MENNTTALSSSNPILDYEYYLHHLFIEWLFNGDGVFLIGHHCPGGAQKQLHNQCGVEYQRFFLQPTDFGFFDVLALGNEATDDFGGHAVFGSEDSACDREFVRRRTNDDIAELSDVQVTVFRCFIPPKPEFRWRRCR